MREPRGSAQTPRRCWSREGQTPAMFSSQHEQQKGFMRGFESPEPVEIHFVGRSGQSRHLAKVVNEEAGVDLHHVILIPWLRSDRWEYRFELEKRRSGMRIGLFSSP